MSAPEPARALGPVIAPGPVIGVDLGQKRDPTAVCVAELDLREAPGRREVHYLVRHLQRLPLGTPYPEVARKVARLAGSVGTRAGRPPSLYLDATGVGQPVLDAVREELATGAVRGRTCPVFAVYLLHGDERREEEGVVKLGKAWLVNRLQALLQARRVHLPTTPEARALREELLDYEIRVDANAVDRYGAFRTGAHDDLVTALGLAVQVEA